MCEPGELVLSDVHANSPQSSQFLKQATTRFYFRSPDSATQRVPPIGGDLCSGEEHRSVPWPPIATVGIEEQVTTATVDEDGDLVVARKQSRCGPENVIVIDHAMATTLKDVGLQVWQGCLLLCDFLLTHPETFRGRVVLELGAGVGLGSIVTATVASHVFCTDTGEDVLETCRRNVARNPRPLLGPEDETRPPSAAVQVRELDWFQSTEFTQEENNRDCSGPFQWDVTDREKLQEVTVILAADVVYDNDLTDAFFRTLRRLMVTGHEKTAFIALEKRLNFTIDDLDVTCKEYDHYRRHLADLASSPDVDKYSVEQLPIDFPQCFQYERTDQLELWQIKMLGRSL